MASRKEYKMTIPKNMHARQAKLGEPLSIDVGGGEIIIMHLNKPGLEHLIDLPARCGLDAIFEALGNRKNILELKHIRVTECMFWGSKIFQAGTF